MHKINNEGTGQAPLEEDEGEGQDAEGLLAKPKPSSPSQPMVSWYPMLVLSGIFSHDC